MNLPNKLTIGRFVLTMIFLALASVGHVENGVYPMHWKIAFALAIIAGFTDYLDGYLARRFDLVTDFGKLMDPLTDKIFTVSCFVVLTEYRIVPGWITVLILTREFAVTGLRTIAANRGQVMSASSTGKLKTGLQMAVLALGGCIWVGWFAEWQQLLWFRATWLTILTLIVLVTIYSGFEYYIKGRDLYIKDMK